MTTLWRLALLAAVIVAAGISSARAEPSTLLRFYFTGKAAGQIEFSPADPAGALANVPVTSFSQGDLELIFFRRIGISATRQWACRQAVSAAGQNVKEEWEQTVYNLALYLRRAGHDRFNVFLGAGTGSVDAYRWSVDGLAQQDPLRHEFMPLTRAYAGVDYTFERIGFRLEFSRMDTDPKTGIASDRMQQVYRQFILYIPFN